jgi:hypothetical protein
MTVDPPSAPADALPPLSPRGLGRVLLSALPVLLAAFVYRSLVNVYFSGDDFLNLFYIVNENPAEYILRFHGGHLLLTRNAIFYLSYHLFGPRPEYFLATVFLTHLVNVWLLFRLVERLTASGVAAAFAATLWGVCPMQSGTLGWYAVYGQVLVASILLVILNGAARAASGTDGPLRRSSALAWPLLLLVASTCFGVGIGVTLVAPVVLFLLLPPSRRRARTCIALCITAAAIPLIYRVALWFDESYFGRTWESYVAVVTFQGAGGVSWHQVEMVAYLAGYGLGGLVFGFLGHAGKFDAPGVWIASAVFLLAAAVAAVRGGPRLRRQLAACALVALGCYAIIAAGRAQYFGDDALAAGAAQPRYHYVASLAYAVMLGLIAALICRSLRLRSGTRLALFAGWMIFLGWSYHRVAPFIDLFPSARRETQAVLYGVRNQVARVPAGADVYIANRPFGSIGTLYFANQAAFPGWAAVFTIFFSSNVVDGRRVHFAVKDPAVVAAAAQGRRTASVIVLADQPTTQ